MHTASPRHAWDADPPEYPLVHVAEWLEVVETRSKTRSEKDASYVPVLPQTDVELEEAKIAAKTKRQTSASKSESASESESDSYYFAPVSYLWWLCKTVSSISFREAGPERVGDGSGNVK